MSGRAQEAVNPDLDPVVVEASSEAASPFPRTLDPAATLTLPKEEIDAAIYEQVLLWHVNVRKDFRTLMKMEVLAELQSAKPEITTKEMIQAVNDFEAKLAARERVAATGRDERWDKELQMLKDASEVAQSIPALKGAGVAAKLAHTYAETGLRYYNSSTAPTRRVGTQLALAAENESIRNQRESTVRRLREAQQADSRVREAANILIAPIVDASFGQDAKTMLAHSPELTVQLTTQALDAKLDLARQDLAGISSFLESHIGPDGSLTVQVSDLYNRTTLDLAILKRNLTDVGSSLTAIGDSQSAMFNYLLVKDERAAKTANDRVAAEEEALIRDVSFQGLRASSQVIGALLGRIGTNSELGKQFTVVSNAAIDIAETLNQYDKTMKALRLADRSREGLEMAKVLGTAAMAAGLIGAGLAIVSLFASSGPSADQLILEQLAAISEQIEDLREEMHGRFDRVDRRLDHMFEMMVEGFEAVLASDYKSRQKIEQLRGQLGGIAQRLTEMDALLRAIDANVLAGFEDEARAAINRVRRVCIDRKTMQKDPRMDRGEVLKCALDLLGVSEDLALARLAAGEPGPLPQEFEPGLAAQRLAQPTAKSLRYLYAISQRPEYRVPATASVTPSRLPNLLYWSTSVQGFHDLYHTWPDEAVAEIELAELVRRFREPGDEATLFLRAIQGEALLNRVLDAYQQDLEASLGGANSLERLWRQVAQEILARETKDLSEFHTLGQSRVYRCGASPADERFPALALTPVIQRNLPSRAKVMEHLRAADYELCYKPQVRSSNQYWPAREEKECTKTRRVGARCYEHDGCYDKCVDWLTIQHPARGICEVGLALELKNISGDDRAAVFSGTVGSLRRDVKLSGTLELTQKPGRGLCEGYEGEQEVESWLKGKQAEFQSLVEQLDLEGSLRPVDLHPTLWSRVFPTWLEHRTSAILSAIYGTYEVRLAAALRDGGDDGELRAQLRWLTFRYAAAEAFLRAGYLHGLSRHDPLRASLYGDRSMHSGESLGAAVLAGLAQNQVSALGQLLTGEPPTIETFSRILVAGNRSGTTLSPPLVGIALGQRAMLGNFRETLLENLPALQASEPLGPALVLEELELMSKVYSAER